MRLDAVPKPSMSGAVPRPNASIAIAPVIALPLAAAFSCAAISGAHGIRPVSSPKVDRRRKRGAVRSASVTALRRTAVKARTRNFGGLGVKRAAHGTRPVMPSASTIMNAPATSMAYGRMASRSNAEPMAPSSRPTSM